MRTTYYLLLTANCQLLTVYYLLLTTYYLPGEHRSASAQHPDFGTDEHRGLAPKAPAAGLRGGRQGQDGARRRPALILVLALD